MNFGYLTFFGQETDNLLIIFCGSVQTFYGCFSFSQIYEHTHNTGPHAYQCAATRTNEPNGCCWTRSWWIFVVGSLCFSFRCRFSASQIGYVLFVPLFIHQRFSRQHLPSCWKCISAIFFSNVFPYFNFWFKNLRRGRKHTHTRTFMQSVSVCVCAVFKSMCELHYLTHAALKIHRKTTG